MKLRRLFKRVCAILLLFVMIIPPVTSDAHPGRTDSNGGHYNRKTGEYHYHNRGVAKARKKTTKKKKTVKKSSRKRTRSTRRY